MRTKIVITLTFKLFLLTLSYAQLYCQTWDIDWSQSENGDWTSQPAGFSLLNGGHSSGNITHKIQYGGSEERAIVIEKSLIPFNSNTEFEVQVEINTHGVSGVANPGELYAGVEIADGSVKARVGFADDLTVIEGITNTVIGVFEKSPDLSLTHTWTLRKSELSVEVWIDNELIGFIDWFALPKSGDKKIRIGQFAPDNVNSGNALEIYSVKISDNMQAQEPGNVGVLPVELVNFYGKKGDHGIELVWNTAQEINNEGFEVQKSRDGENWDTIGFEEGFGSTSTTKNYSFDDNDPQPGVNYYRLKQIDFDGKYEFSPIIDVTTRLAQPAIFNVFPNPAKSDVKIKFTSLDAKDSNVSLLDARGNLVLQSQLENNTSLSLDGLENGVYILKAVVNGNAYQQKIIKA